ncbi:MAG: hypothetical protein BroJett041_23490 [Candidatus Jettenia caeni]|nr:MAG: hypothetical protein BroJett041_23490 [Candidatus Jettenia caeni]
MGKKVVGFCLVQPNLFIEDKIMKKIIIIVLCSIFILVIGAVVTPFLIDVNKYKAKIIDIAKPHVARDLDFDSIKLTILKGLGAEIQGLHIAEKLGFGTHDFLNLERLRIKVKLLPLLKKQIQVKELILEKPVVRLIRNSKGELNIADLMGSGIEAHEDTESPEKKENEKNGSENEVKSGSDLFAGLLVSTFTVNQGHIDFTDEFTRQGTTTTTTIDLLDMKFIDVSTNKPIQMYITARLPGSSKQNFVTKGTVGPLGDTLDIKRLFMDVTLSLDEFNPDAGKSYFSVRNSLPDMSFLGLVSMQMVLEGNIDNLKADCNVDMKDLEIMYGETFHKPKSVPCQISMKVTKTGDDIHLDPCVISMHTLSLKTSGKITGITNPYFDLLMGTGETSLKGWGSLVPALKEYEPEGDFVLQSSLKGTMEDASVNLQFSSPRLMCNLSQTSDNNQKATTSQSFFESIDMKVQAGKKQNNITGNGSLDVKKGNVMAAPFENIQAQFDYQNDMLDIRKFQVHAFQGNVSMNGKVKPREFQWNVKPVVENMNVAEAIDTLTQYKGLFKGRFSGSFTANNAGDDNQKGAIHARGPFRIDQGEIMNVNLVDTVLDALFGIKSVSKFLGKEGGELDKQKVTRFDYLDGDFSMTGNKINVKKIALHNIHTAKATDSDAFIEGLIDYNTSSLDLKGKVVLSHEYSAKLAKKADPLNALFNPENRMVLPITVTGSINKPRPILDIPYITSAMAKYYGRKELEKLGDKIGLPKKGDKDQQGEESPVGNILKEILK